MFTQLFPIGNRPVYGFTDLRIYPPPSPSSPAPLRRGSANQVTAGQQRSASHTDIAEVRPRLPEVCTPQEQRARRGSVKTPHPELVVGSGAVMRWYARCSFCADVADATRSDAELPQFVRAIALLCSVVLDWQCRSLTMLGSHRSRSCIHCSSLPHDSFSSARVLLMTVDQIVDRGHLELVQGAGHHARAVRAADSRGRRHAKRRSRRNRRRWRSTIWAPDWPRCLSRSLSASGSG